MDNKIKLIFQILMVGWLAYLQIQISTKKAESEDTTSDLTDRFLNASKNTISELTDFRFLAANKTSTFTLSDANKKIKELVNSDLVQKHNYARLLAQFNELKANLTSQIKKQNSKNANTTAIIKNLESENKKLKQLLIDVNDSIPKTYYHGPYQQSSKWEWQTTPLDDQILTHPLATKLTIEKESLVTLNVNGHIYTNAQSVQVLFFVDNKPIPDLYPNYSIFYNSFFSNINGFWSPLSLTQQIILKPASYVFQVGINCQVCSSLPVSVNGMSYTITIQELPDVVKITN